MVSSLLAAVYTENHFLSGSHVEIFYFPVLSLLSFGNTEVSLVYTFLIVYFLLTMEGLITFFTLDFLFKYILRIYSSKANFASCIFMICISFWLLFISFRFEFEPSPPLLSMLLRLAEYWDMLFSFLVLFLIPFVLTLSPRPPGVTTFKKVWR